MKKNTTHLLSFVFICFSTWTAAALPNTGTNDTCQTALEILCGENINGTTLDKTDTNGVGGPDAFYKFTEMNADPREIIFSLCTAFDYDPYMRIYTDCNLNNPIENDDSCNLGSEITLVSTPGTTYYIAVEGYNGDTGNFTLSVECEGPPMPPPNDDLANAISIDAINFLDENVNLPDATEEGANPTGCNLEGFNGVWYSFPDAGEFGGFASANIASPSGVQAVIFFEATIENPSINQLSHVDQIENPCFTGSYAEISTAPEKFYFALVANSGGSSDIAFEFAILAIPDTNFENFSMSPNPTSEILNIKNSHPIQQIIIRNMLGAIVLEQEINATETAINIEQLTSGSYILSAFVDGIGYQQQLLKK